MTAAATNRDENAAKPIRPVGHIEAMLSEMAASAENSADKANLRVKLFIAYCGEWQQHRFRRSIAVQMSQASQP